MAKNIALFIDGTWNEETAGIEDTNVRRLFESATYEQDRQVTYYLPGVGTDIRGSRRGGPKNEYRVVAELQEQGKARGYELRWWLRKCLGGVSGGGTGERIREAYAFLSREYERGDNVFIFGFSRGAYAARSLVNFVESIGMLLNDKLGFVSEAYVLYEKGSDAVNFREFEAFLRELTNRGPITSDDDPQAIRLHFLGVWDSVGAMGSPVFQNKFVAARTEAIASYKPRKATVRHAVALHDLRKMFAPLLWEVQSETDQIWQMGFPGAHADVGGGYPLHEDGRSVDALLWMWEEAEKAGLYFNTERAVFAMQSAAVGCQRAFHTGVEGLFGALDGAENVIGHLIELPGSQVVARSAVLQALSVPRSSIKLDLDSSVYLYLSGTTEAHYRKFSRKERAALEQIDDALRKITGIYTRPEPTPPPPRRPPPTAILAEKLKALSNYFRPRATLTKVEQDTRAKELEEVVKLGRELIVPSSTREGDKVRLTSLQWLHDMLGEFCWELTPDLTDDESKSIDFLLRAVRCELSEGADVGTKLIAALKGPNPWLLFRLQHEIFDRSGAEETRLSDVHKYIRSCERFLEVLASKESAPTDELRYQFRHFVGCWSLVLMEHKSFDNRDQELHLLRSWSLKHELFIGKPTDCE